MNITVARKEDLTEVLDLISLVIRDMEEKEIYQWDWQYPTEDIFEKDIEMEDLYIVKEEGKIIATLVITDVQDPEYKDVKWFSESEKVLVVHRLAVHPDWQMQGIASRLMDFAEDFAQKSDFVSIRLDTYCKNPRGISFYERRGYKRCGNVFFPTHREPFYCYEKIF